MKKTKIVSAANFKTHLNTHLKDIVDDPTFLTVNGEGTHVVLHVDAYDELRRYKRHCLEQGDALPQGGMVENGKKPLSPSFYEALSRLYQEEWEGHSLSQLREVKKELDEEGQRCQHLQKCIVAKQRALASVGKGKDAGKLESTQS